MAKRKPTERFNFTKRTLEACVAPETGRRFVFDTKVPTLGLQVTSTGTKTFYRTGRINGRPVRVRIGAYPALTIEQARKQASIVNMEVARGDDPNATRQAVRRESTLKTVFDKYLTVHAVPHKRSWKEDVRQFDKYLRPLHNRRLSDIKRGDIATLHTRLGKRNGQYAANRVLALATTIFNFAADNGWSGPNPTKGVRRFPEHSRERFLSGDELRRLFKSLADDPDETFRDYVLVCLLTGARRGNVQSLAWVDVDFDRAVWRIPESASKSGNAITIPLVRSMVELLERRQKADPDSGWVFQSYGRTGHIVDVRVPWARILERAGILDLRMHDLRRTIGSWAAGGGASLPLIGRMLGHRDPSATAVYARIDLDPVRAVIESTTQAMLRAAGVLDATPRLTRRRKR